MARSHRVPGVAVFMAMAGVLWSFIPTLSSAILPPVDFLQVLGWKDDIDLVVSPDREFLIVCEEREDGSQARVRVLDLDPATGQMLGIAGTYPVPGFENGVDPLVIPELAPGTGRPVLIPYEAESGTPAGVLLLLLDASGAEIDQVNIALGPLGFRPDVDGVWTHYFLPAVAFLPLESEDATLRGVLAIDVDPRPAIGDGLFGGCTLVSNGGPASCESATDFPDFPLLPDGVDPVAYERPDCCARLALPCVQPNGDADLLLLDFDPNFEPPQYETATSVRELNAAGARPTNFPGYEIDVDLKLFTGGCNLAANSILVPTEGRVDDADLYLLDQDGQALWTYSHDSGNSIPLRGFEKGVDLIPMCSLGAEDPRVAVPIENAAGTDADLLFVRLSDGHLLVRAEDPALNPGLTIPGYEIGVDPVLWTDETLVVPVEGATTQGLLSFAPDGDLLHSLFGGAILGFIRSVDPVVDERHDPPLLYVPVGKDDGSDANLLVGTLPPFIAGVTLETANAGEIFPDLEWDVDVGLVSKAAPGGAFLFLPEENPSGTSARLRIQQVPTLAKVAVATRQGHAQPATLYFLEDDTPGHIVQKHTDLLGLETGLDMTDARGPISRDWEPDASPEGGRDDDGDPTLVWISEPTSSVDTEAHFLPEILTFANPQRFPAVLRLRAAIGEPGRLSIFDSSGRHVRNLQASGSAADRILTWDGKDEFGRHVPSGCYWIRPAAAGGRAHRLLIIR